MSEAFAIGAPNVKQKRKARRFRGAHRVRDASGTYNDAGMRWRHTAAKTTDSNICGLFTHAMQQDWVEL